MKRIRRMILLGSICGALSVAALVLPSAPGAVAAARTGVKGSVASCGGRDVYSLNAEQRATCDVTAHAATEYGVAGLYGGRVYTYHLGGSTEVVYRIPPAGFDALRATAAELRYFGMPRRPSGGRALALWQGLMRNARHFLVPPRTLLTIPSSDIAPSSAIADNRSDVSSPEVTLPSCPKTFLSNWAGYVECQTAKSGALTDVEAFYDEPSEHSPNCSNSATAPWVGLGGAGVGSGAFGQDGTAVGAVANLGNNQAWYTANTVGIPVKGLYAAAGSSFYAETTYGADGVHGRGFYFALQNSSGDVVYPFVSSAAADTETAEAVIEWLYMNGKKLANFGTIKFTAVASNFNLPITYGFDQVNNIEDTKVDTSTSAVTASGMGFPYDQFSVTYKGCT